jgi:pimeloyl-ACP methyl ester carboxylesterase
MEIPLEIEPTFIQIPADDVMIAADAFGDCNKPPVVLLHGGFQTRHSWRATGRDLASAGWYAITVDLRGHGQSGWSPNGEYSLECFANDVLSIVRYLRHAPVIVGASLGGMAALAATDAHPRLALGLVLVDVSPFIQQEGSERILSFMSARPDGFASLEDAADAVNEYLSHRPHPASLEGLRKNLRYISGRYFWHWDPAFLRSAGQIVQPTRLRAAALSLRVPTLLLRGGKSNVLSEEDARRFLNVVPHAEFRRVEDAHHMVAGDDNRAFGMVLVDFLDRRIRPNLELLGDKREFVDY